MKKTFFILTFAICLLQGSKADAQIQKVYFTELAPASDGFLDEWLDGDWIESTSESMQFQVLHDNNFLYIAARIKDSTPASSNSILNTYDKDCLELYLSMDTTVNTAYKNGCWQIRFQRKAEKQSQYVDGNSHRNTWSVAQLKASPSFTYGVQTEPSTWTVEVTLPFSVLKEGATFDHKFLRLAIRAVDNTTDTNDGPCIQSFWPSEFDDLWHNPKHFAVVELLEKTEEESQTGIRDLESSNGLVYVLNGNLFIDNFSGPVSIYGLTGKKIMTFSVTSGLPINVFGLEPGLYLVKSKTFSQRIVLK